MNVLETRPAVHRQRTPASSHVAVTARLLNRALWVVHNPLAAALWLAAGTVAAMMLLPIAYLLVRGLANAGAAVALLRQARVLELLANTVGLALAVTAASVALALPLAWLTTRADLPLRRAWTVLSALPLAIPSYIYAYLAVAALGPRGMLQGWLEPLFGMERLPSIYGFPGAMAVLTLLSYPYILLTVRAALLRLDPSIEEASRSLGWGPWTTFRRAVLPQLRPALVSGSLLVALYVLRDFGAVSVMRYNTFTRSIYVQYQSAFDRNGAALLSLALVALTLIILAFEARTRGRARYYRTGAGAAREQRCVQLGRWRWPALLFCASVVGLALLLPAGVLSYWLVRGLRAGEELAPVWMAMRNSALGAGLAAGAALLAALPVAALSARHVSRPSHFLELATYAGFALPGIALALALVFFGIQYARPLYQTLPMLIMAYVILFLPQAAGTLRASWLQVHPSLEEAARGLGNGPLRVLARVTLPLVRPGVLAAAGLVFLTAMKELPATLILGPAGFRTLATSVWSAVSEAFFARAAAPALVLILVSSLPLAYLTLKERGG